MAIVSLSAFVPEELPGVPYWRLFPKSDISSYAQIWKAANNIAANCISKVMALGNVSEPTDPNFLSDTGWDAVGKAELQSLTKDKLLHHIADSHRSF